MIQPQMNYTLFAASVATGIKPPGLSPFLEALWLDATGDWQAAHHIAQDLSGGHGALLHAYLHRKEEDKQNAAYWYHKAGIPFPTVTLEEEWKNLVGLVV